MRKEQVKGAKTVEELASLLEGHVMCNLMLERPRQQREKWPERMKRLYELAWQRDIHALGIKDKMGTKAFASAAKKILDGRYDDEDGPMNYWETIVHADAIVALPVAVCATEGYEQCLIAINECNTITVGWSAGNAYSAFRSQYASVAAARASVESPEDGLRPGGGGIIYDEMALVYFELQKTVRKLNTGAEILSQMLAGHLEWYSIALEACDGCCQNLIDVQDQPENWRKIFDYVKFKISDLQYAAKLTLDNHQSYVKGVTPNQVYTTPSEHLGLLIEKKGVTPLAQFLTASLWLKGLVAAKYRIADWRVALEKSKLARARGHEEGEDADDMICLKRESNKAKAAAKKNFVGMMLAQDSPQKVNRMRAELQAKTLELCIGPRKAKPLGLDDNLNVRWGPHRNQKETDAATLD